MAPRQFYRLTAEETARELRTDPQSGLTAVEACRRFEEFGPNQLHGKEGVSALRLLIDQFKDFIIWVLIGAALVSGFLQEWVDAVAIVAIVVLNALMGFIQEYRADKSLTAFVYILMVEGEGIERARTGAFIVLAVSQLVHSFNCRSMTESIFRLGVFTNVKLVLADSFSFLLQMAVVYLPFLQRVFKTAPLSAYDWCLVMAVSSLPLWAMEAVKQLNRRWNFLRSGA